MQEDLRLIEAEFGSAMGDPERVARACGRLREELARGDTPPEFVEGLLALAPLLRKRAGAVSKPLFDLLEEAALTTDNPWAFLRAMLSARDPEFRLRALDLASDLAERNAMQVDSGVARDLSGLLNGPEGLLSGSEGLTKIAAILQRMEIPSFSDAPDPVTALYVESPDVKIRRLAASVLDIPGEPAPSIARDALLDGEAQLVLSRYLDFTRASHRDLLEIAQAVGSGPAWLASFRAVEERCGERLLREAIAEIGWSRVNLGIEVATYVAVSVGGSFPFLLTPEEAQLLDRYKPARRIETRFLITAHGGTPSGAAGTSGGRDPIERFKTYNLAHAEVLGQILSVTPLSRDRVESLIETMDRIIGDFVSLFSRFDEECAVLQQTYGDIKERVLAELRSAVPGRPLNAELTRLVQMFEDPKNLAEVRTLHGLKRYLHQKGLRLGFRLVDSGRATNRSVDLILATPERIAGVASRIRYVDFEPEQATADARSLPYPVRVVADGFGRQMLHGETKLPDVKVFCYGNEVHYYIAFGNHPAFLRIDYSPPLRGGMIDLEYYGVSKYELTEHPAPDLPATRHFLRRLDFDATIANTRIHARYDKERAVDLADLFDRVEWLFRLVPYLMDLDWTIGSLRLSDGSRREVAAAWSDFFLRWGALPVGSLLTRDRQGILLGTEVDPAGTEREIAWQGEKPYRDRYSVAAPEGFREQIDAELRVRGIPISIPVTPGEDAPSGQIPLDRTVLRPLREAIARGEVIVGPEGLTPASPSLFEPFHEAQCFARLLADEGADDVLLEGAARLAAAVAPLERVLRFQTTGRVNGYEVQRARLILLGGAITLFVLRDGGGIVRLAFASDGGGPCRKRVDVDRA